MKLFILTFTFLFSLVSYGSTMMNCPYGQIRVQTGMGLACVPRMANEVQDPYCPPWLTPGLNNPFMGFPAPLFQPQVMPYWAYQGHLYYPNLAYPGAWQYPGIQSQYYPGQGQVFAAKPNVYIDSIHGEKKFKFQFLGQEEKNFLVTTPLLSKEHSWQGKVIDKDKFEVEETNYDYLFYDLRLPKEKMQFTHGVCTTREMAIEWMLSDLKLMKYSAISLQDFEEHWRVKIPDYPYYCIYPQYNAQLDPVIPVEIDLEQTSFIRSLYVLIPHKKEPNVDDPQEIPFPTQDPGEFRPGAKIQRENMFREWGVAFLGFE